MTVYQNSESIAQTAVGMSQCWSVALQGAFTDDDTDIEFVTLHAVERYGLDINYAEITQAWKTHINDYIWVANREARGLMEQGLVAPDTGRKENNKHWYQIDPQLVNEIWSAFYPRHDATSRSTCRVGSSYHQ